MLRKRSENSEKNMPKERERRTKPTSQLHNKALEVIVFSNRASDRDSTCCWHLSSAPGICLARSLQVLWKAGHLEWGVSLFSPLPLLLPKQLTSSDVVLWLYSRQHCSCGHDVLSVSESESC